MVESTMFPQLAIRNNVSSVPKIIINGTREMIGVQSMEEMLDFILKE
jgi:protein-disulfide isomerase